MHHNAIMHNAKLFGIWEAVYSHCKTLGPESMGSNMLWRNVHTGLRQGRYQDPLFPIVQVPFPVPPKVPVPCSVNKPYRIVSPVNFPQIISFTGRIHIKLLTRCHSFLSQNWALFHNMLKFYISSSKRLGNRSPESNNVTTAHYGIASGRVCVQSAGSFTKKTA